MLALGGLAGAAILAVALSIDWFPTPASTQAHKIDTLFDVLLVASVPVFMLVVVIVLYSVWKFRVRPGEEERDGAPIHGNTKLEVIWTAVPALMMLGLCTYAFTVLQAMEKNHGHDLQIGVVGQQFEWHFSYPAPGGKQVTSNVLMLPDNREVHFNISTTDVIHSFWLQNMRVKIAAMPGITTHYRITPDRLGNYPVVCAELCGTGHSTMRAFAKVVTPATYDAWIRQQSAKVAAG
jgi:cytochrome c oxidase subunit 2